MTGRAARTARHGSRPGSGRLLPAAVLLGTVLLGCASLPGGPQRGFDALDDDPGAASARGRRAMRLLWRRRVVPEGTGPAEPVERARPALDPTRGRLYLASTAGLLQAYDVRGRRLWEVDLGSPVEAPLRLLPGADGLLLVPSLDGTLRAVSPADGAERWRARIGAPVRTPILVADEVGYLVTEEDEVLAVSLRTGEVLWRYRRSRPEGFAAQGHAAAALDGQRLLTGLTDGTVVALDKRDGTLLWERDTSLVLDERDLRERVVLTDVDTTPVVRDGRVYVASFAAGLFVLDLQSGSQLRRESEWTAVTALLPTDACLVLASADRGLACLDWATLEPRWRRSLRAGGAPAGLLRAGRWVVVPMTEGPLLAFDLRTGRPGGGLASDFGFTALPARRGRTLAALSDAGYLYLLGIVR